MHEGGSVRHADDCAGCRENARLRHRIAELERLLETERAAALREIRSAVAVGPEQWAEPPARVDHSGRRLSTTIAAAATRDAMEAHHSVDVAFYPDFRAGNPYQDMLLAGARAAGLGVATLPWRLSSLVHEDARLDRGYAVNIHWTAPILQNCRTTARAVRRLERFTGMLRELQETGGRLIWTIHNVLPHECPHRLLEIELNRALAAHADVIHVLHEATIDAVRDFYPIDPARTRVIAHAGYQGVYPDTVGRAEARARHGLGQDDVALLALGGIRRYKNPDRLLDAFTLAAGKRAGLRLLVAGEPGRDIDLDRLVARCASDPRIVHHIDRVPDTDLQWWLRAADIAVLPYGDLLNSGFLHLATTFGLPVVGPDTPVVRAVTEPAWTRTFASDTDVAGLADALVAASDHLACERARTAAAAWAARRPPRAMAEEFRELLASIGIRPV